MIREIYLVPHALTELGEILWSKKYELYSHLPEQVFSRLLEHVRSQSSAYWVEGVRPTVFKGWIVEWQEEAGAAPVQAHPARRSPIIDEIERHHIGRELRYGRCRVVPRGQSVRWASHIHIVRKGSTSS